MSKFYVSTKTKDGRYVADSVPERVYVYVKQLEAYIRYPNESRLKELYWERFNVENTPDSVAGDSKQEYKTTYPEENNK